MTVSATAPLLVVLVGCGSGSATVDSVPDHTPDAPAAVVVARTKHGGHDTLRIHNRSNAALVFELRLLHPENVRSDPMLPLTAELGAHAVRTVRIERDDPDLAWSYRYRWGSRFGRQGAVASDVAYGLPYPAGTRFRVMQGANGSFSHQGSQAWDWAMPEGTPIAATRGGIVVDLEEGFSEGGADRDRYYSASNYLFVAHEDGTVAVYRHLRSDGAVPDIGDEVRTGEIIGYSGNTGFSTRPHLHFEVRRPVGGFTYETRPIRFETLFGPQRLVEGDRYESTNSPR